jgi:hypothetical protein
MYPITAIAHCYVEQEGAMCEVFRVNPENDEISFTNVRMSITVDTGFGIATRMEGIGVSDAMRALALLKKMLPEINPNVIKLTGSKPVQFDRVPAIGYATSNFYLVIAGKIAIAPAWLLLDQSATAVNIQRMIEQRGIWGELLDAR